MKKMARWAISLLLIISLAIPAVAAEVNADSDVQNGETVVMTTEAEDESFPVSTTETEAVEEDSTETETASETATETKRETEIMADAELKDTVAAQPDTEAEDPEPGEEPGTEEKPGTEADPEPEETAAELIEKLSKVNVVLKKAECTAFKEITVQWEEAGGMELDGYVVYRKTANTSWARIGMTEDTSYTDTSAEHNQKYYYTVRAYKLIEEKGYQGPYDRNGISCEAAPKAPVITSKLSSATKVQLTWTEVSGADGYKVYLLDAATGKWKTPKVVKNASYMTEIACGQKYTYTVRAFKNENGKELLGNYDKKGVTVQSAPATPVLKEAKSVGTTSIKVSWNAAEGAKYYRVYRKASGEKNYSMLVETAKLEYTDTKAKAGQTYTYTVKSYVSVGKERVYSDFDRKGVSAMAVPAIPIIKEAKSAGYNSASISWSAVSGATNYKVYRKEAGEKNFTLVATTSKLTYTDTGLECGHTYVYTLKAYVVVNGKQISSDYDRTGKSVMPVLAVPVLKQITGNNYESINVSWNRVDGAEGYLIYRKEVGGSWERIAKFNGGTRTSYTDTTADSDKVYVYTVRAYRTVDGESMLSNYDKIGTYWIDYPLLYLPVADDSDEGIMVSWAPIEGADGYLVYRKTKGGSWKRIADVKSSTDTWMDKTAVKNTYYIYTVRAYCKAGGKNFLGSYDTVGSGGAAMDMNVSIKCNHDSSNRVKDYVITIKNRTSKPIVFYNDAVIMNGDTIYDSSPVYYDMDLVNETAWRNGKHTVMNSIVINAGQTRTLVYAVPPEGGSLKKGSNIIFTAIYSYDSHRYGLTAMESLSYAYYFGDAE